MIIIFFGDVGDDTLRCIFWGDLCFFSKEGNVTPPTSTHIYRKYHISMRFLINIIFFHFPPKEKISYFLEKRNTIFPDITKKIVFRCKFLGKTIFSKHLEKENMVFRAVLSTTQTLLKPKSFLKLLYSLTSLYF